MSFEEKLKELKTEHQLEIEEKNARIEELERRLAASKEECKSQKENVIENLYKLHLRVSSLETACCPMENTDD
jgi:uncharacterized protein YlxW (UPF0749 family)